DNDVVHTLMPDRSDQSRDDAAIDPVAIADEVVRSLIPRKCLRYLTCNPFCRRICCDVDPDKVSAVEPDNDEGIEQVETDSWNNEQVRGGNVRRVVTQEGSPFLAGWPPSFDHVLGDARLCDLKPELEQFAVDARRTPKQILCAHLPDQRAQFCLDLRSPSPSTRFPTPIAAKAGPMPTHQRFGSNNHENRKDRREPAIQLNEEPAVVVREASPAFQLASQDDQLMSKHCILRLKPDVRLEWRGQHGQNEADQRDHRANLADSIIR